MTVEVFSPEGFKILFNKNWTTRNLATETEQIDRELLLFEFRELTKTAPRRAESGKNYFSNERVGSVTTSRRIDDSAAASRKRFEEHLAMALWHLKANWPCNRVETFRLLDYQFPLKSARGDKGIGKIDLLGLTDSGRLIVVELKVPSRSASNRGEAPVSALLQGVRYAAIVQANLQFIDSEIQRRFDKKVTGPPPVVQILAPKEWWERWANLTGSTRRKAGAWEGAFVRLARDVEERVGVEVQCLALDVDEDELDYGADGRTPRLGGTPSIYPVLLDQSILFGPALGTV